MATKLLPLMRRPDKGGAETSAWQSYTGFCALPASGAAQGSSSCHKGCRDNEWIFIKCSKYALITLIGLLWFQLWQNLISVQVTFASGLVPAGKEKVKALLKRAENPLISWSCSFLTMLLAGSWLITFLISLGISREYFRDVRHWEMTKKNNEQKGTED